MDEVEDLFAGLGSSAEVAASINNGNSSLLRLVEQLGPQLTSQDPSVRAAGVRFMVQVLTNLTQVSKSHDIASMGSDFAVGYMRVMDGEKDPRNLLIAFDVMRQILLYVPVSQSHYEELFDLIFAYFPITYRPPPGDPLNISAEDLKLGLRSCITATSAFALFAITQLMDKMSTTTGTGKRDTMLTIAACIPVYGPDSIASHALDLSTELKTEVFQASDDAHQHDALTCVTAVAKGLSLATATSSSNPLEIFINPIVDDANTNLKEPESKFAKQCGSLLEAVASGSDSACTYVVNRICSQVVDQYRTETVSSRQKPLLDVLVGFIRAHRLVYESIVTSDSDASEAMEVDEISSPLMPLKSAFIEIFTTCALDSHSSLALKLSAVSGMQQLLESPLLIRPHENILVLCLTKVVVAPSSEVELQRCALQVLVTASHRIPQVVIEFSLNDLIRGLSGLPNSGYDRILNAITELGEETDPFQVALDGVFAVLSRSLDEMPTELLPAHLEYTHALTRATVTLIKTRSRFQLKTPSASNTIAQLETSLLIPILNRCILASLRDSPSSADVVLADVTSIELFANIAGCITRAMDVSQQTSLLDRILPCFLEGRLDVLLGHDVSDAKFAPFESTSPASQTNLAIVFSSIISNARPSVNLSVPSLPIFLNDLINRVVASTNIQFVLAISKAVASIVNKWRDVSAKNNFAESISGRVAILQNTSISLPQRLNFLTMHVWITTALLRLSASAGYVLATQLVSLLENVDLGHEVANHFETFVKDDDEGVLTRDSFATVQLLYKQRLFNHCVPLLVSGFHQTSSDQSYKYLIALLHLIQNTPKTVYFAQLPQLMPLLLRALASTDPGLKLTTLGIIETLTIDAPNILVQHISSLIPLLYDLCRPERAGNPPKVRLAGVRCLGLLPGALKYEALHPFKTQVQQEVGKFLDDGKRIVRKEAANTRNKWFLMLGTKTG
ncbi:hypothetical protein SmJEL517_g02943 [Synchytrium microbalum]|uniref:MMS19 nucleotide excision repair protein n=1 Tax=Synchytrium microbalum TaxID=1806994 RepID=A0A507C4L8_9FUNG|nr:uncharacterized protein SmJEL517_g02943 [Synchytrium microbalum]TPX34338.1 hypothetical protein SmJEL517_g02943 [Synchytrium microbalum]